MVVTGCGHGLVASGHATCNLETGDTEIRAGDRSPESSPTLKEDNFIFPSKAGNHDTHHHPPQNRGQLQVGLHTSLFVGEMLGDPDVSRCSPRKEPLFPAPQDLPKAQDLLHCLAEQTGPQRMDSSSEVRPQDASPERDVDVRVHRLGAGRWWRTACFQGLEPPGMDHTGPVSTCLGPWPGLPKVFSEDGGVLGCVRAGARRDKVPVCLIVGRVVCVLHAWGGHHHPGRPRVGPHLALDQPAHCGGRRRASRASGAQVAD